MPTQYSTRLVNHSLNNLIFHWIIINFSFLNPIVVTYFIRSLHEYQWITLHLGNIFSFLHSTISFFFYFINCLEILNRWIINFSENILKFYVRGASICEMNFELWHVSLIIIKENIIYLQSFFVWNLILFNRIWINWNNRMASLFFPLVVCLWMS